MRWEAFVGLRYLRTRRSEAFVSVITLISTLGVMTGVMVMVITLSVMTGFEEDLRDRILGLHPHLRVDGSFGADNISDAEGVAALLREDPRVTDAAPVANGQLVLSASGSLSGVYARGVDPASASSVVGIRPYMVSGSLEALADRHEHGRSRLGGVVVGAALLDRLLLQTGDLVTLMAPSFMASPVGALPRSRRFVVVGSFDSGMAEYDSGLLYMPIEDAVLLMGLEGGSGVEARVVDPYKAGEVASDLNLKLGLPYWVTSWTESHRNVFEALALEKTVYFLVLMLIILVAAFNIVATLYMVVMEKRRDIAVLRTLGARSMSVALVFVCKGMIIATVGTGLGALFGWLICLGLGQYEWIKLPEGVFYVSRLPVRIVLANFLSVMGAAMTLCLAAAIFPARKAVGVVPVDVLRYE